MRWTSCLVLLLSLKCAQAEEPPNIVILIADDMGRGDVGYLGSDVPTPNIDALANSGVVFTRFYAQPTCSPSRAALLTGKYPIRTAMHGDPIIAGYPLGLPTDVLTLPEILKGLGYNTHLIGKWHLGYTKWSQMPTRRGFDSFFGYLNGYVGYYDGVHSSRGLEGLDARRGESRAWEEIFGKYMPQVISSEAVKVIQNATSPFFLLVASNAPHTGNLRLVQEPPPKPLSSATSHIEDLDRRVLAEVVSYVDNTLGDIVEALESSGQLNNTIILFLSDNGAPSVGPMANHGSNYPQRGGKMSVFEGGVRVPAVFWSPKILPGTEYNDLIHMSDLFPTLYEAAGGKDLPKDLDGMSHWESLISNSSGPRDELLVEIDDDRNNKAFIRGRYKIAKISKISDDDWPNAFYGEANYYSYPTESVLSSKVAKILNLTEITLNLTVEERCSQLDQEAAVEYDCITKYCLFDLVEDPSECFDIAQNNSQILNSMIEALDVLNEEKVLKVKTERTGRPDESTYWSPWLNQAPQRANLNQFYLLSPLLALFLM